MSTTFQWYFGPLEGCDENGLSGVAKRLHFTCTASAGDSVAVLRNSIDLSAPDPSNFTPLVDADQAARAGWFDAAEPDLRALVEATLTNELASRAQEAAANAFVMP